MKKLVGRPYHKKKSPVVIITIYTFPRYHWGDIPSLVGSSAGREDGFSQRDDRDEKRHKQEEYRVISIFWEN
jgi:hypothetical protein